MTSQYRDKVCNIYTGVHIIIPSSYYHFFMVNTYKMPSSNTWNIQGIILIWRNHSLIQNKGAEEASWACLLCSVRGSNPVGTSHMPFRCSLQSTVSWGQPMEQYQAHPMGPIVEIINLILRVTHIKNRAAEVSLSEQLSMWDWKSWIFFLSFPETSIVTLNYWLMETFKDEKRFGLLCLC